MYKRYAREERYHETCWGCKIHKDASAGSLSSAPADRASPMDARIASTDVMTCGNKGQANQRAEPSTS